MIKRVLGYAAFGLLVYAAVLALTFPADRAYRMLQSRLPPQLQLYDLEGSVWHGRAAVAQLGGYRLAPVVWQYRPLGLLGGRMDVKLDLRRGPARAGGVLGVSRDGGLRLTGAQLTTPAAEISRDLGLPFVQLQGELVADVALARTAPTGRLTALNGKLMWKDARVVKPADFKLGGVEVDFTTGDDGLIKGRLHDTGGTLQLHGLITLKPDGSYRLNADLATRDNSQPALTRFLNTLGRQGPGGKVSITQNGTLPPL